MNGDTPDSELPPLRTVVSPVAPTPAAPLVELHGARPSSARGPASARTVTRDIELPRVITGPLTPESQRGQRIALAILLVLTFLVAAWIASGLWVGIALGTVMAFTVQPVFRMLARRLHKRRAVAAGLVTAATGLVASGVGALFLYVAVDQLVTIGGLLQHKLQAGSLAAIIGEPASRLIDRMGMSRVTALAKIHAGLEAGVGYAASAGATIVEAASGAVLGLMMALLTMYYVLLEWRTLIVRLERVLPLNPRHTRALILEFRQVGRGVLMGTVATAVVQGLLGGMAYAALGVPEAPTWALATGFGSFLPVVGTGIVWGPIGRNKNAFCSVRLHDITNGRSDVMSRPSPFVKRRTIQRMLFSI